MTKVNLRFSPEILRRLGEELVPHPDLGVVELVRNAYDADATMCTVELDGVDVAGGRVTVADNGDGMTGDEIISGWLLLGKSSKAQATHSRTGRRKVGEKGLGRLAALRLGRAVTLTTRPKTQPHTEYILRIDWTAFDGAEAVEDVPLALDRRPTTQPSGTEIEIVDLNAGFDSQDVERLARAFVLLTGPFPGPEGFRTTLDAPEFRMLEKIVRTTYFEEAEYRVVAELDDNGQASAKLVDWRGSEVATGDHFAISSAGAERGQQPALAYLAPAATFELWAFVLSNEAFVVRNTKRTVTEVKKWLRAVGGVHLYHRGLRVHPYGDEGHDWLDMNLRRVRSPELRPGTNTALGRISVVDEAQLLIPKTDRTGFLETSSFRELARFGRNVLDWAANERLRIREARKAERKAENRDRMRSALTRLENAIQSLPPRERAEVRAATDDLKSAYDEKVSSVESDLVLYRTLSTVGTTTAVFAHETKQPVDLIEQAAGVIARRGASLIEDYPRRLGDQVSAIQAAATSLRTFAEIPLRLLHRRKRKPQIVSVNDVVDGLLPIFQPHLDSAAILVERQLSEMGTPVQASVSAIEAILANLLANATYAFLHPHSGGADQRTIVIRTETTDDLVILSVLDNGPGIDTGKVAIGDIWLPGVTTREDGTGLGLTIVSDVTRDLGGRVNGKAEGELGGAEFNIEIPRVISRI
ncbi:sensor histidine kinase [Verrucosispora sp. TAA-831]|uniref:sensor histidine kinase n=1 Tax=Verrucosispora sp. TAA-831 TaxID=3422227 RepID=UPI003D6E0E20